MQSDMVYVNNRGKGYMEALQQTEAAANYRSLSKKDAMHLRLLTEEMMGLLKALTGERAAEFWIESEGSAFRLHLKTWTEMNNNKRRQLLAVTTSGENAAATGVLGKLRDLYERMIEPTDAEMPYMYLNGWSGSEGLSMDANTAIIQSVSLTAQSVWSLRRCINNGPQEDWDGLEKSIIANIADDVEIGIASNTVEMTVVKTF